MVGQFYIRFQKGKFFIWKLSHNCLKPAHRLISLLENDGLEFDYISTEYRFWKSKP